MNSEEAPHKEAEWHGYYASYLKHAARRGVGPLEILDERWFDGRTTAETSVFPYIDEKSVVLEIASGLGRVSRHIAPRCKQLVCTDILGEALEQASKLLTDFDNVRFEKINGYDLSGFEANSFDFVCSFTAFFHLDFELVVNYFAEIGRVLKSGGVAVIEFKRWRSRKDVEELLAKIEKVGGLARYETHLSKWRYVSADMLKILCDYHGMQVLDDNLTRYAFRMP